MTILEQELTIAIMSDLHCRYGGEGTLDDVGTYLITDLIGVPESRHPIKSLKSVINNESLKADILLCPGDITDKANKQGLVSGWAYVNEIKVALGNPKTAATVGNHDIDSYNLNKSATPDDLLKKLSDSYPTENTDLNNSFWSKNYCIIEQNEFALLIINSSYSQTDKEKAKKCEISTSMLEEIEQDIKRISQKPKICLLHHHPIHHSNIDYADSDFVERGDKLLSVLSINGFSIVIHGHKHDPRIVIHDEMAVFACGSFSSLMNLKDVGAENTFHLVRLSLTKRKGKIESWVFGPAYGWSKKHDTHFPCYTGFGSEMSTDAIATRCNEIFNQKGAPVRYDEIISMVPDIEYLTPTQQKDLARILNTNYSLQFIANLPNRPSILIDTI